MKFLEKTLEEIIHNNLFNLYERGLNLLRVDTEFVLAKRQVQLGGYGIADLIIVEISNNEPWRTIYITIVECKLGVVDLNAYQQAQRYKTAVNRLLKGFNLSRTHVEIKTVLIGSELVTSGDFVFVLNNDSDCEAYTYTYDFDGIRFKVQGRDWGMTVENLPTSNIRTMIGSAYKKYCRALNTVETQPSPF